MAIAEVSFAEWFTEKKEKASAAISILGGMLPGGTFQMQKINLRGGQVRVFKNLPPAMGDYMRPWFKVHADKEWMVYEEERYTFREVEAIMDAVSHELAGAFGIKPGDRVGIAMRNLPEFMIAFLAITSMGAVAVPLNALWKGEELEYAIRDSGSKVVFADPERLRLCAPFASKLGFATILCRGDAAAARECGATALWADLVKAGRGKEAPRPLGVGAEDDCMIMYTSGSTGFPKGVVHSQRSVGTAVKLGELLVKALPAEDSPKALFAVPLFHITALSATFLLSITSATQLIMMRRWDAGEALKLIQREKVTRFTGVPTMVRDMLEHPEFRPETVASVKNMVAGGAPVPPSQVAKLRSKAKNIQSGQGYGLTETMAFGTVNRGTDYLKHPTSCGKPIPLMLEIAVKDPDTGKLVPDGQRGEICLRSAMLMTRYHNRDEDTKKSIDAEGFFHSGDIGKREGGFIYILDRLKDLIIRGGENIDCSEVETALYTHPAVRECSVFGLPDERLGEVVGAAVWATDDLEPKALSEHTAKALAKFKVPEPQNIFMHSEELPKGATGKLDKKGLRAHYQAKMATPPRSRL